MKIFVLTMFAVPFICGLTYAYLGVPYSMLNQIIFVISSVVLLLVSAWYLVSYRPKHQIVPYRTLIVMGLSTIITKLETLEQKLNNLTNLTNSTNDIVIHNENDIVVLSKSQQQICKHDFRIRTSYTSGWKYICIKCGMKAR